MNHDKNVFLVLVLFMLTVKTFYHFPFKKFATNFPILKIERCEKNDIFILTLKIGLYN